METLPKFPDVSTAKIGSVLKKVNATINGTAYQVNFFNGKATDGQEFTKVTFGGSGVDPEFSITINYLNILGINYGEDQYLTVHFPPGSETSAFLDWFDYATVQAGLLSVVYWTIAGFPMAAALALGGIPPKVAAAISTIEAGNVGANLIELRNRVHGAVDGTEGLWIRLDNHYLYPWAITPWDQSSQAIYVRQWFYGGAWAIAFPAISPYWTFANPFMAWTSAFLLSQVFHAIGDQFGYGQMIWLPDPPTPAQDPPTGPSFLHSVTVNGYDTSHGTSLNGAQIKINDFDIGTTSSTFNLTPETHAIEGVHLPHLFYENLAGYPPEEPEGPTLVEITSDETITLNYVAKAPLYVCALEPSTGIVEAYIYSSGQPIGFGELYAEVPVGTYTISVDYQTVHWGETVTVDYIMVNEEFYSYGGSIEISLSETYTEITFVYRWGY